MLSGPAVAIALAGGFLACAVLTRLTLAWLARRDILDRPNARSSHASPTPRGGGLAVTAVVLAAFAAIALVEGAPPVGYAPLLAALALAAVSWVDDLSGAPIAARLGVQVAAVAAVLWAMPALAGAADAWVGPVLGPVCIGLAWIWFVNLYNFMDGIDGLAGAETASIGLGVLLLAGVGAVGAGDGLRGAALAGAALGFLVWNWHPARVFLGDVGSVPVGFLVGWLLLRAAAEGAWAAALILPGYFLVDATVTLISRALRGQTPWHAHREHAYQRALKRWPRHDAVTLQVTALNVVLVALALVSAMPGRAVLAVSVAGLLCAALLARLGARR